MSVAAAMDKCGDTLTTYPRMTPSEKKEVPTPNIREYSRSACAKGVHNRSKGITKKKSKRNMNQCKYRGLALLLEAADKVGENIQEISDTVNIKK